MSGLSLKSFNELINLNASSNFLINYIMQNNYMLHPFQTSFATADYNSQVQKIANNISPEKITSDSKSTAESTSSSDDEQQPQTSTPSGIKRKIKQQKRKIKREFIKDGQQRASSKYKRKAGIIKKKILYDTLTGSQSSFLSICNKGFFSSFANDGKQIQSLMPKIMDAIETKEKNVKNSYASCKLTDENKPISTASQRIVNSKAKDKIIFASKAMCESKSIDFNDIEDSSDIETCIPFREVPIKIKKSTNKNQKENIKPTKAKKS